MDQRISLVTLGVENLERSRSFYEQLGWRGQEVAETVFFQAGGSAVVLWSREKLAADCGLTDDGRGRFDGVTLAHNVRSTAEVDAILETAGRAGARITRPVARTFYGGYAGVFLDPDGHAWEVAHNPGFRLGEDGSLLLPDFSTAD
ncbi:MAG: VOC family protein [Solirubrobacteraceae bacterium]